MGREKQRGLSESFITGVIALIFLIVGYQVAFFIHNAALVKIASNRDEPDTVYIYRGAPEESLQDISVHTPRHSPRAQAVRRNLPRKTVENFRFDPNSVSLDELCRLGFTVKQAESIIKYRNSGGRFRRKEDFKRSFVVSDSVYRRLEDYIDIPLVDLNTADSAEFDALPGIGGWFASKIIAHRKALGGYSYKEQLMDIYRFDQEKFDGLSDLIVVSPQYMTPYPLWTLPADSLRFHPYIADYETARAIVLFRDNNPRENWTAEALAEAGIIDGDTSYKLSRCVLE